MKNKILGIIIIVTIIITAIVMIFYGYKIIKQNKIYQIIIAVKLRVQQMKIKQLIL